MEPDLEWENIKNELIEDGSIVDTYIDSDGNERIKFNYELLEILHPHYYQAAIECRNEEVDEILSSLVDKGLIEMYFQIKDDGSLEEAYGLTDLGRAFAEASGLTDNA